MVQIPDHVAFTDLQSEIPKFVHKWLKAEGNESSETTSFWNELLTLLNAHAHIAGVSFLDQARVPFAPHHVKRLDSYLPLTQVLIEQKSKGIALDKPQLQSDGAVLTPLQQALRYRSKFDQPVRFIVLCNFKELWLYNLSLNPTHPELITPKIVRVDDTLVDEFYGLRFLIDPALGKLPDPFVTQATALSMYAVDQVSKVCALMTPLYQEQESDQVQLQLNKFCMRLVFCWYANKSGLFTDAKTGVNHFQAYLEGIPPKCGHLVLYRIFQILDTPSDERFKSEDSDLLALPYVNGGLFHGASEDLIPRLSDEVWKLILAELYFDWDKIDPAIFGSLYESTLSSDLRRSAGMHYTTVENIHKLIDPLFLDELKAEFAACLTIKAKKKRTEQLQAFQNKLAQLTFLDPACGSGNFLTETYLSLRRLENQVIRELNANQGFFDLNDLNPVKVTIDQFYGLELNGFAVAVAKTALWIAQCQMMDETSAIFDHQIERLPLNKNDQIKEGNALTTPWTEVVPADKLNYIIGNPPFSGARQMNADNKQDLRVALGPKWSTKGGDLDLVCGWFKKAHDLMALAPHIKSALVATNSICQGTAVANLWAPLQQGGTEIIFGHHSFLWQSEVPQQAAVYCVIVGMVNQACPNKGTKRIFTAQGEIRAAHINAYLLDGPDVFISERKKPLCPVPEGRIGNQPIDDGNYLFTPQEKAEFLKLEPQAAPYFQRWFGGEELLNGKERYCLYLDECSEEELDALPEAKKRVDAVRQFRLNSKSIQTQKIADQPTRFHVVNIPKTAFLVIPEVSSGRRDYIPIAFMRPQDGLCSNLVNLFPDATLIHFSILSSAVHMTWVRMFAGRLKMDYRYSIKLVYNCFPWPQHLSPEQEQALSAAAQEILDARAAYPNATLAQLYDPETMPAALKQAHEVNDHLIMQAYGFNLSWSPEQVLGALVTLYCQLCAADSSAPLH